MPPWLREKIGMSATESRALLEPFASLRHWHRGVAIRLKTRARSHDARFACRFDRQFRSPDIGTRGERVAQQHVRLPQAATLVSIGAVRRSCCGAVSSPMSRMSATLKSSRSCSSERCVTCACARIGAGGARFELADVSGAEARISNLGDAGHQRDVLSGQRDSAFRGNRVGVRLPNVGDEREAVGDEPLADRLQVQRRRLHAARPLPHGVRRNLQRPLELLGSDREQQRENGILEQACVDQIRASDAQIGQRGLERRAVPQRDRHRFLARHAIVDRDPGRERRAAGVELNALADTLANLLVNLLAPADRVLSRRASSKRHGDDARRNQHEMNAHELTKILLQ